MIMFSTFEHSVSMLYRNVLQRGKEDCSRTQQLGVTCLAGYAAGAVGTIVSNPADNIVSTLLNKKAESMLQVFPQPNYFHSFCHFGFWLPWYLHDVFFRQWGILDFLICLLEVFQFGLWLWDLLWPCSGFFMILLKWWLDCKCTFIINLNSQIRGLILFSWLEYFFNLEVI